ncbi:MAG TPA: lysylphosphatidylglycerol synthase transmembrane domain-containing protein [Terriglobales bacterium]|nr:lysylphosphatidylglycerol synthase transmembrane domain-containing protein [Terriglobales bacterium]
MTEQQDHHRHPIGDALGQEADALMNPETVVEMPPAEQMSIVRRLREPKTILSIAVPLAIIVIAALLNGKYLSDIPNDIGKANPWLILLAFLVYYVGFPLRGWRWTKLLRGAGYKVRVRDGTEILFLSWLVNCIVPAKLGDLYRAYLLRLNSPVSATKTLGTVFMERILDLIAIAALGILAGYWNFHGSLNNLPPTTQFILAAGVVIVVVLIVALVVMRNFGRRVISILPLPHRIVDFYDRFEEGVFGSVGVRGLPLLGVLTIVIWMTEAMRLFFVVRALGFADVNLGLSGAMFVALIGSLLTALPLTPGGIGLVETGMGAVLVNVFNASTPHALAIVLVDRAISVFSIVVLGSIAYVISSKPRGGGMEVQEVTSATTFTR